MAASYWIKLYLEILEDPKMATLPDRLWRRVIEMFLCAGKFGQDGLLPETKQLAWVLRMQTDELELDLRQIAMTGIIERQDDGWLVTKFSKRQAPVPDAERQRQHRDRIKKQQYYGDVTPASRDVRQINRLTDTETDTETEAPSSSVSYVLSAEAIFCKASGMATFPGTQLQYIAIVEAMRDTYGAERTIEAMKHQFSLWRSTKRKDGSGNYSGINLVWIDRAQEELAGGSTFTKDVKDMTSEEFNAWAMSQGGQQNV